MNTKKRSSLFKTSLILALAGSLCALASPSFGQAVTNTPPNVFQQIGSYFTVLDPSSRTWTDSTAAWIGADYVQGVTVAQTFGVEHDLWTSSALTNSAAGTNGLSGSSLSIESVTRNAGIAGTILSSGMGIGYNLIKADVKGTAFIEANYDFLLHEPGAEFGIRVKKAMASHTFAGMQVSLMTQRIGTPTIGIFTGITF